VRLRGAEDNTDKKFNTNMLHILTFDKIRDKLKKICKNKDYCEGDCIMKEVLAFILTVAVVLSIANFEQTAPYELHAMANHRHVPWTFTAFDEPCFRARPISRFSPQNIHVFEENDYGWARISTVYGDGWVYTNANKYFTGRIMGIFDERGDANYTHLISPQVVTVLYEYDGWIKIPTWLGERWINLNFTPPTYELDRLMQSFGNSVSVHFENMDTGFVYTHNADRVYFAASAIKAPYALYVYLRAERGEADLSRVHTYTAANHWGGSGRIQHMPFGTTFTELELLSYALSISDNVAFRMLVHRIYGFDGYREFVASLGANPYHVRNVTSGNMTARDAGIMARAMHEYIESGGIYSEHFREALLANRYPFVTSDHPVASKSGWDVGAYHDIAIVYAPSPYTLVIMSEFVGNAADRRVFNQISMAFQDFNDRYFTAMEVGRH